MRSGFESRRDISTSNIEWFNANRTPEDLRWLEQTMPGEPPIEALRESFTDWMTQEAVEMGISDDVMRSYELANPLGMSADGLQRYWKKVRMAA